MSHIKLNGTMSTDITTFEQELCHWAPSEALVDWVRDKKPPVSEVAHVLYQTKGHKE